MTAQGFPQINAPIIDSKGKATYAWVLFFTNLWTRTGGGNPPTPIADGTYIIAPKLTPLGKPGSITTMNGQITAITTAS